MLPLLRRYGLLRERGQAGRRPVFIEIPIITAANAACQA